MKDKGTEEIKKQSRPKNIAEGIVFCGHRHLQCMRTMSAITGIRSVINECGEYVQGFLTNDNLFVTRHEAFVIAKNADQIINENILKFEEAELYREDLY